MRLFCRRLAVASLLLLLWTGAPVHAQSVPLGSARVLARSEGEVSLVQNARLGLGYRLQLESRLLLLGLIPNVATQWEAISYGAWHGALRLQLTYPGVLLRLLAREGAGGLLPPGTEPADTVMLDLRWLGTYHWPTIGEFTLGAGLEVAPRRAGAGDQPVLDFPLLFPRFGALHHGAVTRTGLRFDGLLPKQLSYSLEVTSFTWPGANPAWSLELGGSLRARLAAHFVLELGWISARTRLPVGTRWHWLPWFDLRFPFDP